MGRHTTQRDINAAERGRMAIQLRKQGHSLDEIAQQCGYADRSGAWRSIKRELDRFIAPEVEDYRKVEEMRLDDAIKALYPKLLRGDTWAIAQLVNISKRRSEVTGMDKRPDEDATQQNYTKRIILTHEFPTGGQDDSAVG